MDENILLKNKINELEKEIIELKEHLKKYTAPTRYKKYYQNHKEELLQKNKEYIKKTNYFENYEYTVLPDKKKEYNKRAYLKRKENNKL
jgi:hypothetical protein